MVYLSHSFFKLVLATAQTLFRLHSSFEPLDVPCLPKFEAGVLQRLDKTFSFNTFAKS